ncbi:MAG: lipopolysaccharide biosynthesis protein [Candidatus Thiodiazotropha sp. (ex Dulcina madagascariensis)]|nr:lipopolysaccharide biosynthesis protein [Candidatus Thiodiazotropha sp. (ex Dulcina madagascariensis)]
MEEEYLGISDYLAILKRRKKQLVIPALVILIMSAGLAFGLPSVYRSEATILIEQQEIPSELVRSTVTSYAGERIQVISQRVMTTENLGKIIDAYGLYKDEREETSLNLLVEMMREEIGLEMVSADVIDPRSGRPTTATIAFKLSFNSKSPRIAQKVTSELSSLYLSENLKQRERSAVETSGFLAAESEKLNDAVRELENKLATFKEKNFNKLPELQQLNIQLMERNENTLTDTDQKIRMLQERIIYLQSELAQMNPTTGSYSADGRRIYGTEDRLMALQAEYVSLAARYTDNHPTLLKMKEEIGALQKEINATELTGDPKNLDARRLEISRVDNPAYVQLQTQLKAAQGELRSLESSREEIKNKLKDLEVRLMQSPQVEREYHSLARDYENALAKYQEVKAKQLEAELSESLERERKGERFSLIEPPLVPESPDQPNRIAILFIGFIASFAGGLGNVALRESTDDAVHGVKEIISVTKVRPLAVIPYMENRQAVPQKIFQKKAATLSVMGLLAICIAAVHYLFIPLDVLWYVLLRKTGIGEVTL